MTKKLLYVAAAILVVLIVLGYWQFFLGFACGVALFWYLGESLVKEQVQQLFSKGKEPLFEENIVAWKYGPVVKDVYYKYNEYGNNNIPKEVLPKSFVKKFTSEQIFVMKMVFDYFKDCSAIGLMNKTHNEEPWKSTKRNSTISFDKISSFFKDKFDIFCRDVDFEEFNEETKKAIKDTEKNIGKSPTYDSVSDMFTSMGITTH